MAAKRGKRPTKKVKNLAVKKLSAKKAKLVRGGATVIHFTGTAQDKIAPN